MKNNNPKPTCIKVISWAWIVMGVLMILSGGMGLFAFTMMKRMSGGEPFPPDVPSEFQPMMMVFRHFDTLAIAQIGIALVAIVAGVYLLRMRSWARRIIQGLNWGLLTYIVGFSVYWIFMWWSLTSGLPVEDSPVEPDAFKYFGAAMALVINGLFCAPIVLMIYLSVAGRPRR